MRKRIWKSAGSFYYCGQVFEAHYRADAHELCEDCEKSLLFLAQEKLLPQYGRTAVAQLVQTTVSCAREQRKYEAEFTVAPAGEMVLLETDHPEGVVDGFLAGMARHENWLSRVH